MASIAPGAAEQRIRDLVYEIFEPTDIGAAVITPILKARSASFLVLAHAEIEYALELECLTTAGLLKTSSDPTLAMIAWGFAMVKDDGSVSKSKKKRIPLETLIDSYQHIVNTNNGIKENNLEALLLPIGVDLQPLNTDIATLNSFGARRGDLAHQPLINWKTTDLPSVHVSSGIQAGRSVDQIILAIRSGHASVVPKLRTRMKLIHSVRRKSAIILRKIAMTIDKVK